VFLVMLVAAGAAAVGFLLFRDNPVPVTVFRVAAGRVEEIVTNSKAGTVETRHRATLSPEIGGRVAALHVREGDRVRRGDLLMQLAAGDYRARVALRDRALGAARAGEREACLAAELAGRDHRRYASLDASIVTEEQLDRLASARDVALAACEAAGALVEEAPGVPIPPVIELLQPDAIYVSAPLDEVDLGKVRVGLPVRITFDAHPGRTFDGRIVRVAPYVLDLEEHSRTFEIEAELSDAEFAQTLLPGTSADVEAILDARDDALRVPSYALIEGGRVLVVESERLVEKDVETGLRNWRFTEIVSGLEAGEAVVVSHDRIEVRAGATARIAEETDR
jgi:HlyD family secretion protein